MKVCNKCGEHKPLDRFSPDKRNKDGLQGICVDCGRSRHMIKYHSDAEYKAKFLKQQADKRRQRKLDAIEYKGGKCFDCGSEYHPSVYEFHHLDPASKDVSPAHLKSASWERFKAELDKCVMLCANCHRQRHWREDEDC